VHKRLLFLKAITFVLEGDIVTLDPVAALLNYRQLTEGCLRYSWWTLVASV